jgi:hypothetical protein
MAAFTLDKDKPTSRGQAAVAEGAKDRSPPQGEVRRESHGMISDQASVGMRCGQEQYKAHEERVVSPLQGYSPLQCLQVSEPGLCFHRQTFGGRRFNNRVPGALVARYRDRDFEPPLQGRSRTTAETIEQGPLSRVTNWRTSRVRPPAELEPHDGEQASKIANRSIGLKLPLNPTQSCLWYAG